MTLLRESRPAAPDRARDGRGGLRRRDRADGPACGLRPRLLVYESVVLPPDEQTDLLHQLKSAGYRFIEVGMDTYAVQSPSES